MAKRNWVGYIFGLKDPVSNQYIYVGVGKEPWLTINRWMSRPPNEGFARWRDSIKERYAQIQILGKIVAQNYHGAGLEIPEPPLDRQRLEWDILGEDQEEDPIYSEGETVSIEIVASNRARIINDLLREGHPLLNRRAGRPKGQ